MGRRGAALVRAGSRPRRSSGARERNAGAEGALPHDLPRHGQGAPLGRVRAHRAGRRQRRRGHSHVVSQRRKRLGHQRPQVLHHQRRARVVERRLRDDRSRARPLGSSRVRRREGHARIFGRQDRRQDGPSRERDRGARIRRLPRARREPARRRRKLRDQRRLHDRHEDLRQHTARRRGDGDRHRTRGVRIRTRLREGPLRDVAPHPAVRRDRRAPRARGSRPRSRAHDDVARRMDGGRR